MTATAIVMCWSVTILVIGLAVIANLTLFLIFLAFTVSAVIARS